MPGVRVFTDLLIGQRSRAWPRDIFPPRAKTALLLRPTTG
jgi:hypothetical protein